MKISIITLFPEIFPPILNFSILKRAQKKGLVEFEVINLRDFGQGVHKIVDDRPYGGGVGMVLKADVLAKAASSIVNPPACLSADTAGRAGRKSLIVSMSASGVHFTQKKARQLSNIDHLVIVCGHYEGVDQRFIEKYVDEEISIGDYILTGGEIPAMAIIDSIVRLIPGVLEKKEAVERESFSDSSLITNNSSLLLEHPHYTRPEIFNGKKVPQVLLSGDHQKIERWRKEESLKKTKKVRPDLLKK